MYTCMLVVVYVCIYCICMYVYIYTYVYVSIYICVIYYTYCFLQIWIYLYIIIYVYIDISRHVSFAASSLTRRRHTSNKHRLVSPCQFQLNLPFKCSLGRFSSTPFRASLDSDYACVMVTCLWQCDEIGETLAARSQTLTTTWKPPANKQQTCSRSANHHMVCPSCLWLVEHRIPYLWYRIRTSVKGIKWNHGTIVS